MACGTAPLLGLCFEANEQGVKAFVRLRPEWQGYAGALHGGMIATLLDAAMTHCLFHQRVEAMTADLRVRYLAPVPCPSRVEVRARLAGQRKMIYELDAELRVGGIVKARATAKFMRQKTR